MTWSLIAAWSVHLLTACGAVCAFFGLEAVFADNYRLAFGWMFLATVIDSVDGSLARLARVGERLPFFRGAHLDDVIDYVTFVFLPAVLIHHAGLLPARTSAAIACAILLASAFGFSRVDAKTTDHFFTGFPSYWNIVAFYLYAGRMGQLVNAALVLILCGLVFVPTGYVYPSRTPVLRAATVTFCAAWAALVLWLIWHLPAAPRPLVVASLTFPAYYTILSLALHWRRTIG